MVNYAILVLCGLSFANQLAAGRGSQDIVERYGMVPARLTAPDRPVVVRERAVVRRGPFLFREPVERELAEPPFSPYLTLITCMFLHGGWMHFFGNMLFLYIFGDNVEDRMGHLGYAVFYVLAGILALSLIHI